MAAYDTANLAVILGVTQRAIRWRAQKEAWQGVPRLGRGGGQEYRPEQLPPEIQAAIALHQAKQEGQLTSCAPDMQAIPPQAQASGEARFLLVTAWKKARARSERNKTKFDQAWLAAYNAGPSHPAEFKVLGRINRATLFRWEKKLAEADGDWRVLCDHRGWAPAEHLEGKLDPQAQEVFLGLYLTPQRLSARHAYRAMCTILTQRNLAIPSQSTVYRFVRRYAQENADHVTLMREGEKALADKIGPYIDRDDKLLEVGDVLFADGHRFNFDSIHPFTGRPVRLILIVWQDWASRMPVGWEVMPEENTVAIAAALKMAIRNLGRYPKVAYIDNGRAFRGAYFSHVSPEAMERQTLGLFHRLGIAVQYSRPYQARTKIVERFFETFNEQCQRLLPSYRGASIGDKPAYLLRNEKFHQARHEATPLSVAQTLEVFREYVGWYCQQPHEGLGGRLPGEVFAAGRGPGVNLEELNTEFMWRREVRPRRCRVRLAGIDFESDALYGLDKPLVAHFAWNDLSQIHLYERDGARRYLGAARPVEALHPVARHLGGELDLLKVKEANQRQARLKKRTLQLARETGSSRELLAVLPWMQAPERVSLPEIAPPAEPAASEPPQISEAERRQIAEAQAQWAARRNAQPPYERPRFDKPLERYSHLFELKVFQGVELLPEDAQFMAAYEDSDEYPVVHRRFDQLMKLARREGAHA